MNSPSISICSIFKNEEFFMTEFLDSFMPLADQWVLVDTGSQDRSLDIINSRGISYHYFKWCNHFSKARNYSIRKATSDWIFIADIDDRIRSEDIGVIRNFLSSTEALAVTLNYVNLSQSDWLSKNPSELNRQVRMVCFRNGYDIHYRGAVHEDPLASIEEIGGKVEHLDIPMYHLGYVTELLDAKVKRNVQLLEERWAAGDRDPDLIHYYTNLHWSSETWIRDNLKLATNSMRSIRNKRVLEDLFYWYMDFDPALCEKLRTDLLVQMPNSSALTLYSARNKFYDQDAEGALTLFEQLWAQTDFSYPSRYRCEVAQRLAFLHASFGRIDESITIISKYLSRYTITPGIWHLEIKLRASQGNWQEVANIFSRPIPVKLDTLDELKKLEISKIIKYCPIKLTIHSEVKKLIFNLNSNNSEDHE